MTHYNILIATPGAKLEAGYVSSLVATLAECSARGLTYKWLNGYSSLVHHARELTASGGLNLNPDHKGPLGDSATYNKIIWIDSDIEWSVEDFFKLYDADYDVISGAYLLSDGRTSMIHTREHPGGIPKEIILSLDAPMSVQGVGFGFIAIKSGVFESMERPWFTYAGQKIINSKGEVIVDSLGEDISWCLKVKNLGITIMFDPSVLVTHIKTAKIGWS